MRCYLLWQQTFCPTPAWHLHAARIEEANLSGIKHEQDRTRKFLVSIKQCPSLIQRNVAAKKIIKYRQLR